jgi:cytochrome c551/c552
VNDLVLGIVAGVLVVFALVASMVLPRLRPDFPGRRTGLLLAVTILLVGGMLAAVEALGESHEFHAEGSEGTGTEPAAPPPTGETGTGQPGETETGETGGGPTGDPEAGQAVFASAGCGSCHTFAAANASGTIGPNLDDALPGANPDEIRTQIVDPDSEITEGFGPGIMPSNFGEQLNEAELANLVAFLAESASG